MLHNSRTFEEKRIRSRSADPSKRFRKTDIFNTELTSSTIESPFSSEYTKSFAWPKQLNSVGEENLSKRLNPIEKTHPAGLSSKQCGAINKAHVIENSNGSRSIVIGVEPPDCNGFAFTTGSATNLATMEFTNKITQDAVRPLTSMGLVDTSRDLNKSSSSNGSNQSKVNKSVTITNINDYTTSQQEQDVKKAPLNQIKDSNNNTSILMTTQNNLDEKLLFEKLSKLNTYESIYGTKAGAQTLFQREEVIDPDKLDKLPKTTEYKSRFKPFSTYVYVPGKGWFKPKKIKAKEDVEIKQIADIPTPISINIKPQDASSVKSQATTVTTASKSRRLDKSNDTIVNVYQQAEKKDATPEELVKPIDETDSIIEKQAQPWYQEALERKLKANEFRYRSEYGNPILGRSGLEEVYKKASGFKWEASQAPKFEQLQQMRSSTSAFLPYDQHKQKLHEDKTDSSSSKPKAKAAATPSKSPRTKRATSVPPRKKSTGSTPSTTTTTKPSAQQPSTQPTKVWIKPKAKETTTSGTTNGEVKETKENKVQRPPIQKTNNNLDKELKEAQKNSVNGRASPPILQSGPVRVTQIKTPEELSGIKSPPAANFLEQFDNEPINWTNSSTKPSNATNYTNLMNEFNPTSIRSDNLADLSGLKI